MLDRPALDGPVTCSEAVMLPDDPDAQARILYLSLLGMAVASGLFFRYRDRLGAALQHAAIWVLIFLGVTLAVGFYEPLMNQLNPGRAALMADGRIELRRRDDGHFHADVAVNGTELRFLVDTGASALVLSRRDAERAGIELDGLSFIIPVSTANGRVYAAPVRLDRIEFGGFTDRDVPAMVNGGDSGDSLLGMDYLGRFQSLQIEGDRMYLTR
jgi:aspartyl protease family protein